MTPDDLDAILAGATDPAAATLARALREAWEERDALRDQLAAVTRDATETEAELRITQNFAGRHMGVVVAERDEARAERDAALAAVDAVRADYAPRREPPTADEVRALERMQVAAGYTHGVASFAVGMPDQFDGVSREMSADRVWVHARQFPSDEADVVRVCGGPRVERLGALWWLAIVPTGPVAWSELARLVEGVRRG